MTLGSLVTVAAVLAAADCASYNAMWSAEHHAGEARRLERIGQPAAARLEWTQAATQAQAVLLRHPSRHRADAALVLQAEALARSGACQDAAEPLARGRASARDAAQRERVDLAEAECAIAAGRPLEAETALTAPLASRDADRRSRAEFLAGEAAMARMDYDAALGHFTASHDAVAQGSALVGQQRARIARTTASSDLTPIVPELTRLLHTEHAADDAAHLLDLVHQVTSAPETPAARFRRAEIARDSLGAPALAGRLFLDAVNADTASLYAPKALIAALVLLPECRDSIVAVLDSRYAASPYTRAFHGEPSVAYAAAEESLAHELGVATVRNGVVPSDVRFDVPLPGPRGPRPLP
jgi:hypothetical protein